MKFDARGRLISRSNAPVTPTPSGQRPERPRAEEEDLQGSQMWASDSEEGTVSARDQYNRTSEGGRPCQERHRKSRGRWVILRGIDARTPLDYKRGV